MALSSFEDPPICYPLAQHLGEKLESTLDLKLRDAMRRRYGVRYLQRGGRIGG
ncbi:hypothetical protein CASFOL_000716 [Castilleja foliolosa]|uniref:Uncharacterized protein n=1 Tax=Castilleja foliolosa TaxID=1961234 RepID=A0ABD3EKI5_9LAMI